MTRSVSRSQTSKVGLLAYLGYRRCVCVCECVLCTVRLPYKFAFDGPNAVSGNQKKIVLER